jgi:hypothetical protein
LLAALGPDFLEPSFLKKEHALMSDGPMELSNPAKASDPTGLPR